MKLWPWLAAAAVSAAVAVGIAMWRGADNDTDIARDTTRLATPSVAVPVPRKGEAREPNKNPASVASTEKGTAEKASVSHGPTVTTPPTDVPQPEVWMHLRARPSIASIPHEPDASAPPAVQKSAPPVGPDATPTASPAKPRQRRIRT